MFMSALNGAIHKADYTFRFNILPSTLVYSIRELRATLSSIQQSLPQACALQLALEQGLPLPTAEGLPAASFGVAQVSPLFTQLPTSQIARTAFSFPEPVPVATWTATATFSAEAQSQMSAMLREAARTNAHHFTLEQLQQKLLEQMQYLQWSARAMHEAARKVISLIRS
jgi:hypothetical protein